MPNRDKVLVVDDEPNLRELVSQILSKSYNVISAANGQEALELAKQHLPQVILLDYLMPGMDGVEVCTALRANPRTRDCRVVMLTAFNGSPHRIAAFAAGADDYIEKPFSPVELIMRVASKMRRVNEYSSSSLQKKVGNAVLDLQNMSLRCGESVVALGTTELKILNLLSTSQGTVVTRNELIEKVWGVGPDRLIDPHITSLRKKLSLTNIEIKTVYGEGYSLLIVAA